MKNQFILFTVISFLIFTACKSKSEKTTETEITNGDSIKININMDDASSENSIVENHEKNETTPQNKIASDAGTNMQSGTIILKADTWIIRETAANGAHTDYYAENLGDEFKKEGLKVKFTGTLGEIPPNVRLMGKPFTITKMVKA